MRYVSIFCFLFFNHSVAAFELFGVTVNNINRVELREVIRNSGADVIREAGDDNWYDEYDMSLNFEPSKKMFVAYDKASGNFAFLEYHLPYNYYRSMLARLKLKYGKPKIEYGQFESDAKFLWNVDGIEILLQQDWAGNVSRLVYSQKENLTLLNQAYQQSVNAKRIEKLQENSQYF